jgi:type IV pilus assembly protein PilW
MTGRHPPVRLAHAQQGFTLVELMVAAVISLILLAGIIHVYTGSKATYRVEEGLSRVQENGRFALELMGRRIRMAGFQGCGNLNNLTPNIIVSSRPSDLTINPVDVVRGVDNVTTGNPYGSISEARPGTDVLIIRGAAASTVGLDSDLATDTSAITINSNPENFEVGDYLFISDCELADIFEATGVSGTAPTTILYSSSANNPAKLSKPYRDNAFVIRFVSSTYYIQDTGRTNQAGDAIHSLYETDVEGIERELIEGVDDMQITYGVNTDSDANNTADVYQDASVMSTADWSNTVSVRLALLMGTTENVSPVAQDYTGLDGALINVASDDRRLRRRFTTTISLRNRAL